jgi:hypothetical protein
MSSRIVVWAALGLALLSNLGCCCSGRAPWPCGRTYYDCQCGELWWHPWFSHPPDCCDPCDCCNSSFCGYHSRQVQGGIATRLHPDAGMAGGEHYSESMQPTRAEEVPSGPTSSSRLMPKSSPRTSRPAPQPQQPKLAKPPGNSRAQARRPVNDVSAAWRPNMAVASAAGTYYDPQRVRIR